MSEGMVRAEAGAELLANEEAQAKVREEISQCQARIVQTLVPTILALGLLAVADKQSIGKVALGCGFSVLLCSSLYVASLSYKIFRNGAFLSVFTESESREADQGCIGRRLSTSTGAVSPTASSRARQPLQRPSIS